MTLAAGDYNLSVTASGRVKADSENVNSGPITKTIGFTVTEAPTVNTAPIAVNDSTSTAHNTSILVDVLANDTDAEGVVSLTGVITNEVGGTFAVESGKIRFTPTDGFAGTASATYEIEDTEGLTATATLTVQVAEAPVVNTAPTANNDNRTTAYNTSKLIDVLANDTDAESAVSLTGSITNKVGGTFVVESGKIRYTPTNGFTGTASATYEIRDTEGLTDTARLTVQVAEAPISTPILDEL